MGATTPNRAYPYPVAADPNNVPDDIEALASAVDTDVQAHVDGADPHPVYESGSEATARMNAHIAAGHPTVPSHDASSHRFVGAKAVATTQLVYTNLAPPDQLVIFGGEEYDTDTIHSTSSNKGRMTLPFTGYWRVQFLLRSLDDGGGVTLKNFRIRKNGSAVVRNYPADAPWWLTAGDSIAPEPEVFHFAAGDYIEIVFDPSGASSTSITLVDTANCQFAVEYLGT